MIIEFTLSVLVYLELLLISSCFYLFLRQRNWPVSASIGCGLFLMTMLVSFSLRLIIALNIFPYVYLLDVLFIIISVLYLNHNRLLIGSESKKIVTTIKPLNYTSYLAYFALFYLLLLALLTPIYNGDARIYHLSRVFLFIQENSLFVTNVSNPQQSFFPTGYDILQLMFLRFPSDWGLSFFNLISYVAIISTSYSLASFVLNHRLAVLSTLLVASAPIILLNATTVKPELLLVLTASVAMYVAFKVYQARNDFDILVLGLTLAFGLSVKTTFIFFILLFLLFMVVPILRTESVKYWCVFFKTHWVSIFLLLPVLIFLSDIWIIFYNKYYWGSYGGPEVFTQNFVNKNGISGFFVNLSRYLLESIELPEVINVLCNRIFGIRLSDIVLNAYQSLIPQQLEMAALTPWYKYFISWRTNEFHSWYGIFGVLILFSSVFSILQSQNILITRLGLIGIGFFFVFSYSINWMPWNGRLLMITFVLLTPCFVFVLKNRLQNHGWLYKTLTFIAMVILAYTLVFNETKPAIVNINSSSKSPITIRSIWSPSDIARKFYPSPPNFEEQIDKVANGSKVSLICKNHGCPIYYIMSRRRDLNYKLHWNQELMDSNIFNNSDYIICLQKTCDELLDATFIENNSKLSDTIIALKANL